MRSPRTNVAPVVVGGGRRWERSLGARGCSGARRLAPRAQARRWVYAWLRDDTRAGYGPGPRKEGRALLAGRRPHEAERARSREHGRDHDAARARAAQARAHAVPRRGVRHEAVRVDRAPRAHRRSDDRRVRALDLRAAHDHGRGRQREPAAAREQLLRAMAGPRGAAQHRRVPRDAPPSVLARVDRRPRLDRRSRVHGSPRRVVLHRAHRLPHGRGAVSRGHLAGRRLDRGRRRGGAPQAARAHPHAR